MADKYQKVYVDIIARMQGEKVTDKVRNNMRKLNKEQASTNKRIRDSSKVLGARTKTQQDFINGSLKATSETFKNKNVTTKATETLQKNGDMRKKVTQTINSEQSDRAKFDKAQIQGIKDNIKFDKTTADKAIKNHNKAISMNKQFDFKKTNKMWSDASKINSEYNTQLQKTNAMWASANKTNKQFDLKKTNKMWADAGRINSKYNDTVVRTNKHMTNMGDHQVATSTGFNKYGKEVKTTNSTMTNSNMKMRDMLKSSKNLKNGLFAQSQKFNMAALSAMFFGMAIKKVAEDLTRMTVGTFMKLTEGTTEAGKGLNRLGAHWEFLKFTMGSVIAEAMLPMIPAIIGVVEWIRTWIEENPKWVTGILSVAGALGTFLFVFGTLALGVTGVLWAISALIRGGELLVGAFKLLKWVIPLASLAFSILKIVALKAFSAILKHPFIAAMVVGILLLNYAFKKNIFGIRDYFYKLEFALANLKDGFKLRMLEMQLYFGDMKNKVIKWMAELITKWNSFAPKTLMIGAESILGLGDHVVDTAALTTEINALGAELKAGLDAAMAKSTDAEGQSLFDFMNEQLTGEGGLFSSGIPQVTIPGMTAPEPLLPAKQENVWGSTSSTVTNNNVINIDGSKLSITEMEDMLSDRFGLSRDNMSSNNNLSNISQ